MENINELYEEIKAGNQELNDSLKTWGDSPFGDDIPMGVWSWSEADNLVMIGAAVDELELISYSEAVEMAEEKGRCC